MFKYFRIEIKVAWDVAISNIVNYIRQFEIIDVSFIVMERKK